MRFTTLYENERSWIGSSELLYALHKLGIDYKLYELTIPFVFKAEELDAYVESILNDIRNRPESEYKDYVMQRCLALKKWAGAGYLVHVV